MGALTAILHFGQDVSVVAISGNIMLMFTFWPGRNAAVQAIRLRGTFMQIWPSPIIYSLFRAFVCPGYPCVTNRLYKIVWSICGWLDYYGTCVLGMHFSRPKSQLVLKVWERFFREHLQESLVPASKFRRTLLEQNAASPLYLEIFQAFL